MTNGVLNMFPAKYKSNSFIHVASITNPTGFAISSDVYVEGKTSWVGKVLEGENIYSLIIGNQLRALTDAILRDFPLEKANFKLYTFDPHAGLGSVIVSEFNADLVIPFTIMVYNSQFYAIQAFFQDGKNPTRTVSLALPNFDKSKIVFKHYALVAYTDGKDGGIKNAFRLTVYPKDNNGSIRSDIVLAVRKCNKPLASIVAYTLDPPISFEEANEAGIDYILMSRPLTSKDSQALADFTIRILTSESAIGGFMYADFGLKPVDSVSWTKGKEGIEGTLAVGKKQVKVNRLICIPF